MEEYMFHSDNERLRIALKLMKISLEKNPAKYEQLSSIVKDTRDKFVLDTFYPEFMISNVMYCLLRNVKPDRDKQELAADIEFFDCLNSTSLKSCPKNLNDYILAKIDQNYPHRYANYNTELLRRFAQIVINETDIVIEGSEQDFIARHFPVKKSNFFTFFN